MKEYFEGIYLKEQILKSIWNQIYSIDFPAFIVNTSSVHIIIFLLFQALCSWLAEICQIMFILMFLIW